MNDRKGILGEVGVRLGGTIHYFATWTPGRAKDDAPEPKAPDDDSDDLFRWAIAIGFTALTVIMIVWTLREIWEVWL